MVINPDGTASFWYMKGSATNPVISVTTNNLNLGDVMLNNTGTATFNVMGGALTGNVNLTLNDPNGVFTVNPTVISAANASNGVTVTVSLSPAAIQDYNATVTLSSNGAQSVTVNLTGRGVLETYVPTMLPADSAYINLTQFRADWTDETPAENVSSYTLEVMTKPQVELLETADFSNVPDALTEDGTGLADISGNYGDYLPAGWSGTSYLGAYDHAMILAYDGTIKSPTYNLNGYDKVTVVVKTASYYYDTSTITVSTSVDSETLTPNNTMTDYTVVLDCANADAVTLKSIENYTSVKQITIYAGDLTLAKLNATESGNGTYRLITGITDRFYTVTDLLAEGTFVYKVKTLYTDGTESAWSNREEVTLFQNGHGFELGDVNHDGSVSIADVTQLIDYLLDGTTPICEICANVNEDTTISIADVTALIDKLLSGN